MNEELFPHSLLRVLSFFSFVFTGNDFFQKKKRYIKNE